MTLTLVKPYIFTRIGITPWCVLLFSRLFTEIATFYRKPWKSIEITDQSYVFSLKKKEILKQLLLLGEVGLCVHVGSENPKIYNTRKMYGRPLGVWYLLFFYYKTSKPNFT